MCLCYDSGFRWVRDGTGLQRALGRVDRPEEHHSFTELSDVSIDSCPLFMVLEKQLTALITHIFYSYFAFLYSTPGSHTLETCTINSNLLWLTLHPQMASGNRDQWRLHFSEKAGLDHGRPETGRTVTRGRQSLRYCRQSLFNGTLCSSVTSSVEACPSCPWSFLSSPPPF